MQTVDLGTKLRDCCERVEITTEQFVDEYLEMHEESDYRIPQQWLSIKGFRTLRDPSPDRLIQYWAHRKIRLTHQLFRSSRADFRQAIGLPAAAYLRSVPELWRTLATTYQILRPHAASNLSYICETMEIEIVGDGVNTLLYSDNYPDPKFLYEGAATPAERYYFALLGRDHERMEGRKAFRSLAFYAGEGRYEGCLSGILTKGMGGAAGKDLAGLPFVALPVKDVHSLRKPDRVGITRPHEHAEQLYLLHRGGSLLIGELSKRWYPALYDYAHRIFSDQRLHGAIVRETMGVFSIPPRNLRESEVLDHDVWRTLVAALPLDPA